MTEEETKAKLQQLHQIANNIAALKQRAIHLQAQAAAANSNKSPRIIELERRLAELSQPRRR
jgi:hypothetical protein